MKIIKPLFIGCFLAGIAGVFGQSALAYDPDDRKELCKKPHFMEFSLKPYLSSDNIEVPAEAAFSFKLSGWTDPSTIKLTAKNKPLEFKVTSNSTFHKVTAKLPAEYNGDFVRINAYAKAVFGCDDQTGWLVKVASK